MGRNTVKTKAGRIKGKPGSRWAKGQSCVSNPTVTKYRDAASSMYYHQVKDNPLLTANNLLSMGLNSDSIDDDVLSEDIQSLSVSDTQSVGLTSIGTAKTFASNWSKCSNKAFESFLGKCKLDSALHKDMLSILAATSEIINDLGGTHKEIDYFASFVTALEKCPPEQYPAMLALVSIVIGKIPKPVLCRKFADFYPKIGSILDNAMDSNESVLVRMCCDILKKSIAVQDPKILESDLGVQGLIYSILKCSVHENPKVRKKARGAIDFIIAQQNEINGECITFLVIGWILDQLCSYPTCGARSVVDALSLLQHIWAGIRIVPSTGAKKLFESILRAMSSGEMSILKIGFMFFSTMFQTSTIQFTEPAESKKTTFSLEELNCKLVTAIWEFQPNWRNEDTFISWIQCVLNGLVRLSIEQAPFCHKYLPLILDAISPTWFATFGLVPCQIVGDFFPHLINGEIPTECIEKCFQILSRNLISLPPNQNCLFVLKKLLESLTSATFSESAKQVFMQLVPVRTTTGVEKIFGLFLTAFGVENIWNSVEADIQRTIVLPLIRGNISNENISFWLKTILPMTQKTSSADTKNNATKSLVWDSFVGFCTNPADPNNFPAELVGKTIVDGSDVRLNTLAALKQILKWPQSKSIAEKYTKNYLPILFNLYVKEKNILITDKSKDGPKLNEGHAEAIGLTIQQYLPFCEDGFVSDLTVKALKKYFEALNEIEKAPMLDLLTYLAEIERNELILGNVYDAISPLVKDNTLMKRAYRILGAILKNEQITDELKNKIVALLRETKGKTKSNAEPFRLDCLLLLAFQNDAWFLEFVPEAILNLLSVNVKARKVAAKFANTLVANMKEKDGSFENMMTLIDLGLNSPNTFTCACTLRFVAIVYREWAPENPVPTIMNHCINFIKAKADSTVANEAFRFLNLCLSIHKSKMGPYANGIGIGIAAGGLPRKETNKMLARLLKIFGVAGLKAVLPNSNDAKMHRRIKNIQKKLRKMKQTKQAKLGEQTNENEKEVSDDEGYTDEIIGSWTGNSKQAKASDKKLMIKEDLVDFLDPRNITSSLISKPKSVTKKDDQFEMSADGKLIIQNESTKKNGSQDDSDDDDEFNELFKKPENPRKRKLTGAASTTSSHKSRKSTASSSSSKRSVGSKRSIISSSSSKHSRQSALSSLQNKKSAKRRKR